MKKFNTLQELWSYCMFCPLCRAMTRMPHVAPNSGSKLEVKDQQKINQILKLKCLIKSPSSSYNITFHIDCVRNNFILNVSVPQGRKPPIFKQPTYCHFFLLSNCDECGNTSANSSDFELDLLEKKVSNIGVELEGIYYLNGKSKYHLTLHHAANLLNVSRCIEHPEHGYLDENKVISFPLDQFDFSKPNQAIKRIKTLLVFS